MCLHGICTGQQLWYGGCTFLNCEVLIFGRVIFSSSKIFLRILLLLERNPKDVKHNGVLLEGKEANRIGRLRGNMDPWTFTE